MATEPVKKPFSAAHRVEVVVVEAKVAVVEDWPLEEPSGVAIPEVRFRYPLHVVSLLTPLRTLSLDTWHHAGTSPKDRGLILCRRSWPPWSRS